MEVFWCLFFCVCSKHSKKIDKDNSKLSLFILQVIQSELFIPKRWRSPTTFPKKVTKNHPEKVTNSQNCQVFIGFPEKCIFNSPKSPMPKTRFAMPRHKHCRTFWHLGNDNRKKILQDSFLAFSFEKKGCPFTTKTNKNTIKRVDTNHKKNKSLVPTFWITAHLSSFLPHLKKNFPRIWTNVATPLVSEVHTLRIKFLHPSPPIFEGNFCHQTYLSLKFNPLTMGLWITKLSQSHQISCGCIRGHISRVYIYNLSNNFQ